MGKARWVRSRTPGIYRREGPCGTRYKVVYRDSAGRQFTKNFDRARDAENFLSDIRSTKAHGGFVDPAAGRVRLHEFADHFMATSGHLRPNSRELYGSWLRLHILPELGDRRLFEIGKAEIKNLEADMVARGRGTATVGGVHRLLHTMFAVAVEEDRIARNPVTKGGPHRSGPSPREPRILTPDEVRRVADEVPERYKALVYLLAYGGLRIGEATVLRTKHLELRECTVRIEVNAPEVNGRKLLDQEPKTKRSRRTVDLPPTVVGMLRDHLTTFGNEFDQEALMFTNERSNPVLQSGFRKSVFQPAARRVGIKPVPRVHDLRHTAASLMAASGYSLVEAGAQLGHSAITMTALYSHRFEEHRQSKAAALDQLLTGPESRELG